MSIVIQIDTPTDEMLDDPLYREYEVDDGELRADLDLDDTDCGDY